MSSVNRIKRTIIVLILLALATGCMWLFVACDKQAAIIGDTKDDTKYYLYDVATGSYDNYNYIDISGDKCIIGIKDDDDVKVLELNGAFEKSDENKFSVTCFYKIKYLSDILSEKDIDELKKELGLTNFEAEFDAQIEFSADGRMYTVGYSW